VHVGGVQGAEVYIIVVAILVWVEPIDQRAADLGPAPAGVILNPNPPPVAERIAGVCHLRHLPCHLVIAGAEGVRDVTTLSGEWM